MVDSHCEIIWDDNSGADLGHQPTENYAPGFDDAYKQEVISQQHLRSKMLSLFIKKSFTTVSKRKLRDFRSAYTLNTQDYGSTIFFVIVKIV